MTWGTRALPAGTAVLAAGGAITAATLASLSGPAPGQVVVAVAVTVYAGTGLLIAGARPGHAVGRTLLVGAAVWGVGEGTLALAGRGQITTAGGVPEADWLALAGVVLRGIGWLLLVLVVPLLFPDGALPRAPWRTAAHVTAAAIAAFAAATVLAPTVLDDRFAGMQNPLDPPSFLSGTADLLALVALALMAAALVLIVGGLVGRWRSGDSLLRQQLLWFITAAALPVLLIPFVAAGQGSTVMFGLAVLPLPVAIGVAVLQHRLYDVQLAVNRTVAWATLSVALASVYVLAVGGVGALLDARGADWLPWLATGVIALTVAPLRDALQKAANRLTYGQWAQPEAVLAGVRRRIADAGDIGKLLHELVEALGHGLGLARIAVHDMEGRLLAGHGTGEHPEERVVLTAFGRPMGELRWSSPRRSLRPGDRRLLDDIAGQVGALVHAATLVAGLRAANERLVQAREDERRRLRRDLHDGIGSALAGLTYITDATGNLMRTDIDAAEASLRHLRTGIQEAVLEVRRIVDGLTPPSLDQLGLVGAVSELADRLGRDLPAGVAVDAADLPPLRAAVEVATYRVAQEALTNVVRHARASCCRVTLGHDGSALVLEVDDDGSGVVAPRPGGAGLPGMRERAEELGGELDVLARPGCGTSVRLRLPAPLAATAPAGAAHR